MRKSILLFVLFTLMNIPLLLFAQGGYRVTGRILSAEDNQPLIGVSVLEKGTSNGVITDMDFAIFLYRDENRRQAGHCFHSY